MADTVRTWCRRLLTSGDLASKLASPGELPDDDPGPAQLLDAPARDARLRMSSGSEQLPRPGQLRDKAARAACLHRFAHHELMAVELFAWALLAWPDLPAALRRGLLHTLHEEQLHLGLYLARLQAHGVAFGDLPLSDYFWQHREAMQQGGPLAFLCAMGLTLEQANLDFTLLYRDGFRAAGDEDSAQVLQRVHDDEVGHVKLAALWVGKLKDAGETDVEAYARAVPFPLSAARAKGRRFDVPARRRAGLSEEMISFVQRARPYEGPR